MKNNILLLAMIPFVFTCCKNKGGNEMPDGAALSISYVQVYKDAKSLTGVYEADSKAIKLSFAGTDHENQKSEEFLAIIRHFDDNSYNKKLVRYWNQGLANEFTSIDITSDKSFGVNYPAGTSLNSIVKLCTVSAYPYIESEYTEPFSWATEQPDDFKEGVWSESSDIYGTHGYYPVNKLVSDLTPKDLKIMDFRMCFLKFTEIPAEKNHVFTIKFNQISEIIVGTVVVTFE